jgi:hypothetical protein
MVGLARLSLITVAAKVDTTRCGVLQGEFSHEDVKQRADGYSTATLPAADHMHTHAHQLCACAGSQMPQCTDAGSFVSPGNLSNLCKPMHLYRKPVLSWAVHAGFGLDLVGFDCARILLRHHTVSSQRSSCRSWYGRVICFIRVWFATATLPCLLRQFLPAAAVSEPCSCLWPPPRAYRASPWGIPAPKSRVSGVEVFKFAELPAVASRFLLPVSLSNLELYFCFS